MQFSTMGRPATARPNSSHCLQGCRSRLVTEGRPICSHANTASYLQGMAQQGFTHFVEPAAYAK